MTLQTHTHGKNDENTWKNRFEKALITYAS